ncbi:MAG: hypothetical protein ACREM3_03945 [Candidatus Rokuibacteriota bacterium]
MMARRRGLALVPVVSLLALLLAALAGAGAQPPDGDALFQALATQTRTLRGALGDPDLVGQIDAHLGVLDKARSAALGGRISPEYRDSLLADAALLERANAMLQRGERERAVAAVRDAEADLAIKRRHSEASIGFAGSGLRTVTVTVRTVRGTKEEPGHRVWYVPRGWSEVQDRYARFEGLSSPTKDLLAPGNYLMWAGAATDQRREPIVVGGHGRSRQTIDLPLP